MKWSQFFFKADSSSFGSRIWYVSFGWVRLSCIKTFFRDCTLSSKTLSNLSTSKAEFPALTVCADYKVAYKWDVLKKYNLTPSHIRNLNFPPLSNSMTAVDFYNSVTHELEEIILDMNIKVANSTPYSNYVLTNDHDHEDHITVSVKTLDLTEDWLTLRYKTFGRCYTYCMPTRIKKQKVKA